MGLTTCCFFLDAQKAYRHSMEKCTVENLWGTGIKKHVENDENMKVCARSAVMLGGEISKYVDILQGVAQGCTLPPDLFKTSINDLIVAVEAARQGVTVREDTVSRWVLADDFVGISLYCRNKQQIEKALEIHKEMEGDGERKKCAVFVCNKDKLNLVNFSWMGGEDELPIVDHYIYLGVKI